MTLKDFKVAIDREGTHRYHFKALDPEFGTVKEEVSGIQLSATSGTVLPHNPGGCGHLTSSLMKSLILPPNKLCVSAD